MTSTHSEDGPSRRPLGAVGRAVAAVRGRGRALLAVWLAATVVLSVFAVPVSTAAQPAAGGSPSATVDGSVDDPGVFSAKGGGKGKSNGNGKQGSDGGGSDSKESESGNGSTDGSDSGSNNKSSDNNSKKSTDGNSGSSSEDSSGDSGSNGDSKQGSDGNSADGSKKDSGNSGGSDSGSSGSESSDNSKKGSGDTANEKGNSGNSGGSSESSSNDNSDAGKAGKGGGNSGSESDSGNDGSESDNSNKGGAKNGNNDDAEKNSNGDKGSDNAEKAEDSASENDRSDAEGAREDRTDRKPTTDDYRNTSTLKSSRVEPDSLANDIRVEKQHRDSTTVGVSRSDENRFTLRVEVTGHATDVTFYVRQRVITAASSGDVSVAVDGESIASTALKRGGSTWIGFTVDHLSTRTITFTDGSDDGDAEDDGGAEEDDEATPGNASEASNAKGENANRDSEADDAAPSSEGDDSAGDGARDGNGDESDAGASGSDDASPNEAAPNDDGTGADSVEVTVEEDDDADNRGSGSDDAEPERVNVAVENVSEGTRLSINVTTAETRDEPAAFDAITTTVERDGNFTMNVTVTRDPLPGSPAFEPEDGTETLSRIRLNHSISNANVDDVAFTFRVSKERLRADGIDPADVVLHRYADGSWSELPTERIGETDTHYIFRADSPGMSEFAVGAERPKFRVWDAAVRNSAVEAGETATIVGRVTNVGDADGVFEAELVVDGEVVDRRRVTVAAGGTRQVTFERTFDRGGTHEIRVNGRVAGELTVEGGTQASSPAARRGALPVGDVLPADPLLTWLDASAIAGPVRLLPIGLFPVLP